MSRYPKSYLATMELICGRGFMSPGGPEAVRRIIAGLDLSGQTVLDIGCGLGGIDMLLAETYDCRIIGVDVEPTLIAEGLKRIGEAGLTERVELRLVSPGRLPLETASVDLAVSKDSFVFIADKAALLDEVWRVLRPGGVLAMSDFMAPAGPPGPELARLYDLRGAVYHPASPEAYRGLAKTAGFQEIETRDITRETTAAVRADCEAMRGPLEPAIVDLIGREDADRMVAIWEASRAAFESQSLRCGLLHATTP